MCSDSSFLFVAICGESVNPPKLNIQEVQGGFVHETKGRPGMATDFSVFFLPLSNHTPDSKESLVSLPDTL